MPNICQVFLCILMLDSYFSHVMICALSKASIRCIFFFFLSDILFLEILMGEIFFIAW